MGWNSSKQQNGQGVVANGQPFRNSVWTRRGKRLSVAEKGFRPGMVSVVQTFGDQANFHPHVHVLVSRGGWTASGEWIPVPYVDEGAAERLFRHKVLALLRERGLLSQQRIELLLSWRRSGFSVHNRVYVLAGDRQGLEALAPT